MLVDAVPLTLEEIFIYELGGADYAVKDIVLSVPEASAPTARYHLLTKPLAGGIPTKARATTV